MRVKLAGFNIDADIVRRLDPDGGRHLTPETLSAAYARISRSPLAVDQLRKQACLDVEKSRRSNQRIIFEMGHHSVAEHAVFNFDIMGVSRLALEEIERFRLASYTEKSQRYVTLEGDLVLPREIRTPALKKAFVEAVQRQNRFYVKACERLGRRLKRQHAALLQGAAGQRLVEGWAKEDARYILSLATSGQVGMTVNARTLEHMFRCWRLSPREEVRRLAAKLHSLVMPVAPSLILFPEPTAFDREAFSASDEYFSSLPAAVPRARAGRPGAVSGAGPVTVSFSANGDDLILASRLSTVRRLNLAQALSLIQKTSPAQKKRMYREFFRQVQFFSAMPREFEMADITIQASISASCFAQLKRHRMATLLSGEYEPELGCTLPASIANSGLGEEFLRIIDATNGVYSRLRELQGAAAAYVLTNAHRRRILMKMNLREMYHFVRLRDDEHAQWDIRLLAHAVAARVRERMPLAAMMLCGKSRFNEEYERIYQAPPPGIDLK
ncbi:MAG: FAD-dependent thymidylate synthase [Acidobacteria bacterium]|nr:FAD-dependent thymidylate synthase [Acidobacteriota bacterium]